MKQKLVKVLLPLFLPEALTYAVPENITVKCGDFVEVPLGSKLVTGVVWNDSAQNPEGYKIKDIKRKLDTPPLSENLLRFIRWAAEYTLAPAGTVLKMSMSVSKALEAEKQIEAYQLSESTGNIKTTASRKRVIDLLTENSPLTANEIVEQTGVGKSVIKGLLDFKTIEKTYIAPKRDIPKISKLDILLSPEQKAAAEDLCRKIATEKFSATLLDGVTGSGKTEVYFSAIEEALTNNCHYPNFSEKNYRGISKFELDHPIIVNDDSGDDSNSQVLILLPEISLTTQIVSRFKDKFGFEPTQWHSGLTPSQRVKNWRDIAHGRARLVIGARSALFLPYTNLCLIVVDEEHDSSYKQEEGVIYHARDMAVVRASIEKCPIILASATPSLETVENVKSGKYDILKLPSRFGAAVMPDIKIVDMRKEKLKTGKWLSNFMKDSLAANMNNGHQSMLFLNRRGYAPLTLCRECGYRFKCSDCSSWLVEHKIHKKIICHHCGYSEKTPESCPECGKEDMLVSCGPGVERIAEEVAETLPEAKICLMTSDDLTNPNIADNMISEITNGNIDIIIGTQIISKGYHFPKLTHVGVIDADLGLEGGDLRVSERTYQLLQQVSGRAGREKEKGMVVMQSYMPENTVIQSLSSGDRDGFIDCEITSRKKTNMPPYGRLAAIIISGRKERQVANVAKAIVSVAPIQEEIRVLGPVPAPIFMLRGNFRYRILIKTTRTINIQKWLNTLFSCVKAPSGVMVKVDIDPYSFM